MKRTKKAFTLVELLLVVAVIGILASIVVSSVLGSLRMSRRRREAAAQTMLEAAINNYYAQDRDGKWPGPLETYANRGVSAVLSEDEAQEVFRKVVKISTGKDGTVRPLLDPTGLFVARKGVKDAKGYGLPYAEARRGGKKGKVFGGVQQRQPIGIDQMVFGYPGRSTGKFHRFNLIYHASADTVTVTPCCLRCASVDPDELYDPTSKKTRSCKDPTTPDTRGCPYCHGMEAAEDSIAK